MNDLESKLRQFALRPPSAELDARIRDARPKQLQPPTPRLGPLSLVWALVASALVLAGVHASISPSREVRSPTWRHDGNEPVEVLLADKTELEIYPGSLLGWDLRGRARWVELYEGEIVVHAVKESRPFRVRTPTGTVTALGTRFRVRASQELDQ